MTERVNDENVVWGALALKPDTGPKGGPVSFVFPELSRERRYIFGFGILFNALES